MDRQRHRILIHSSLYSIHQHYARLSKSLHTVCQKMQLQHYFILCNLKSPSDPVRACHHIRIFDHIQCRESQFCPFLCLCILPKRPPQPHLFRPKRTNSGHMLHGVQNFNEFIIFAASQLTQCPHIRILPLPRPSSAHPLIPLTIP